MAKNRVLVTYELREDGSLKRVEKDAKGAAKATDKLSNSTDKASKSQDTYSKRSKGVANATSNSTKAFSKMSQGMDGGLVPAYATLAANVFAVTAAFSVLQSTAGKVQLAEGLEKIGVAAGTNLPHIAKSLKEISGNAITASESMEALSLGFSAGFSTTQMEDLTRVARGASIALGRDMSDAMTRLTRGATKLEPELLDELGIMVRLDDAAATYATTLGKTANQLNVVERRQAFLNAVTEQGLQKYSEVIENIDVNPYNQLASTFESLSTSTLKLVNVALTPLVSILSSSNFALFGAMLVFGKGVVAQILPSIKETAEAAKLTSQNFAAASKRATKVVSEDYKAAAKSVKENWKTVPASVGKLEEKFKKGTFSAKELNLAITRLKSSEKLRSNAAISSNSKIAAARKQELDDVRKLRVEMEALKNSEKSRFQLSTKGKRDAGNSRASGITAAGLNQMDRTEGALAKFSVAAKAASLQLKNLSRQTGFISTMRVGFTAAAGAVRLFGSALLNAIPVIGQVIFVGTMLVGALSHLFEDSDLEKQTKSAIDSLDKIGKSADALFKKLQALDTGGKILQTSVVLNGVLSGIDAELNKILNVNNSTTIKQIDGMNNEILSLQKTLRDSDKSSEMFDVNGVQAAGLENKRARIAELTRDVKALRTEMLSTDRALGLEETLSFVNVLNRAVIEMGAFGKTGELAIGGINNVLARLNDGTPITVEELEKLKKENLEIYKTTVIAIEGMKASYGSFNKELVKMSNKPNSMFTNITKEAESLVGSLKGVEIGAQAALIADRGENYAKIFGTTEESAKEVVAQLIEINTLQTTLVSSIKTQEAVVKRISKFSNLSVEVKKQEFVEEAKLLALQKQKILSQMQGMNLLGIEKDQSAEYIALQESLLKINDDQQQLSLSSLEVEKVSLNLSKERIEAAARLTEELKKQATENKIAQDNALKRSKIGSFRNRTEDSVKNTEFDELTLTGNKDAMKAQKDLITAEFTMKMLALDNQAGLLKIEAELLKKRAAIAGIALEPGFIEALKTSADKFRDSATTSLELQKQNQLDKVDLTKEENVMKTRQSLLSASSEGTMNDSIISLADKGIGAGAEDTLNAGESVSLLKNATSSEIDKLAEISPQGAAVAAAIEGSLIVAESWSTAFDTISSSSASTEDKIAGVMGAVGATIGALSNAMAAKSAAAIAGIDSEIEAEKNRDGSSQQSLAKIKAMEAKKESIKRKAFEQDKKMKMAEVAMATGVAIMNSVKMGLPWGAVFGTMAAVMGAAQMSAIASTTYQGGGTAASAAGTSAISVGQRSNVVDFSKSTSPSGELSYARGEQGTGTGMSNFTPSGRAAGGNTAFMVGEQGPEIFVPERPGTILPADDAAKAVSSPVNVSFNISAMDSKGVEDVLRNQRGQIIGMIREAANAHGETFLESVSN